MKLIVEYYRYHNDVPRIYLLPHMKTYNKY